MELFSTPLKKLWESASGSAVAWRYLPEIVQANVSWLGTKDLDFLCSHEARNFCNDVNAACALARTLGIVGIQCPSYRKKIIPVLGDMAFDTRMVVKERALESLRSMGGRSVRPYISYWSLTTEQIKR